MFEDPAGRCIGYKQAKKALEENRVESIFLAHDCDNNIQKEFSDICGSKNVKISKEYSLTQLGALCGIDVGAAVVAILK